MGYTHYYKFLEGSTKNRTLQSVIPEIPMIAEASDVPVEIEYETDAETGETTSFRINGVGDDGHEYLSFSSGSPSFVKTNRKPYDLTVCLILLRMKELGGACFELSSDGFWNQEWVPIRSLYKSLWPETGGEAQCPWEEPESMMSETLSRHDTERGLQTCVSSALLPRATHLSHKDPRLFEPYASHVQTCLSQCLAGGHDHKTCVQEPLSWKEIPGVAFRLIDVYEGRIVEHVHPDDYVALSYVWGQVEQLRLTKANHQHLLRRNALYEDHYTPARTILDAINICRILEKRYLWVDSLCIVQDDSRDMSIQILRMRQVFACASLTIISAFAQCANDGIVSPQSSLSPNASLQDIFTGSSWQKRAWTYQEFALSHRQLIFSSSGLYFACQHSLMTLEENFPNEAVRREQPIPPSFLALYHVPGKQLRVWQEAVTAYSERELTYQKDLINAFQGITEYFGSELDGKPNRFHYGLPTTAFDQAFCWSSHVHSPESRRHEYPSWSWLGWKQRVTWSTSDGISRPEERSSQMLWPQWPEALWNLYAQVYKTKSKAETAAQAFADGNPTGAHQWLNRKPCCYYMTSNLDMKFVWGLPTASMIYNQSRRLDFMGCVVGLRVDETSEIEKDHNSTNTNKAYKVSSAEGDHRQFGVIELDPLWRSTQPECMDFLLVDGYKNSKGRLIGSRMLCLKKLPDSGPYSFIIHCERVRMMDIVPTTKKEWVDAGGKLAMVQMD